MVNQQGAGLMARCPVGAMCGKMQIITARHTPRVAGESTLHPYRGLGMCILTHSRNSRRTPRLGDLHFTSLVAK